MTVTYNPEIYLESATRCLKEYVEDGFNEYVQDENSNAVGLEAFDVLMEFPSDEIILSRIPDKRSIIHFELDDITDEILSFGTNTARFLYDDVLKQAAEQEGRLHILNFDVGIWAWDKSGGTTARLRARQVLTNLLSGSQAITAMRDFSDGGDGQLELLGYSGGHFTTEAINDVRVFRMVNTMLVVRVFSRTPNPIITTTIEDIGYELELVIDEGLLL